MATFKGTIDSLRRDRNGFRSGDQWFNKQGTPESVKGAEVEFTYEEGENEKGWKVRNVTSDIKVIKPYQKGSFQGKSSGKGGFDSEGMQRGNAIHAASRVVSASIYAGKLDSKDAVKSIAKLTQDILNATSKLSPQEAKSDDAPF